jgi:hypothetical protein
MIKVSPDRVIEVDCHMAGEKLYFRRFFCALEPFNQGFREGCHPYLSVDSTVTPRVMNSLIFVIKVLIENQIHWLIKS